jgi:hypothetical protein
MSDGNSHNHTDLPVLVAGGASGKLKGGRHIQNPKDTPMANLLLSMLEVPAGADRSLRRFQRAGGALAAHQAERAEKAREGKAFPSPPTPPSTSELPRSDIQNHASEQVHARLN